VAGTVGFAQSGKGIEMGWVKVADELPLIGRLVWLWWGFWDDDLGALWKLDRERDFPPGWIGRWVEIEGSVEWFDTSGRALPSSPTHWHERWPEGLPERDA